MLEGDLPVKEGESSDAGFFCITGPVSEDTSDVLEPAHLGFCEAAFVLCCCYMGSAENLAEVGVPVPRDDHVEDILRSIQRQGIDVGLIGYVVNSRSRSGVDKCGSPRTSSGTAAWMARAKASNCGMLPASSEATI